ncbi:MAG TPA: PAS domain S-box protein, partial [Sulfuricurvum sp.]|nr:PAS domain S-box protein [Sulfuricurvum sp.]
IIKKSMLKELTVQAKIIGNNSTASLAFDDPKSAEETLSALKANTTIDYCILYTNERKPFASYSNIDEHKHPLLPLNESNRFGFDHVSVYQEIILDGKVVGGIYIQSNLDEMYGNLLRHGLFLLLALFFALLGSYGVSQKLQNTITAPIIQMADLMQIVSEKKNYAIRTPIESHDELGQLAEGFNEMLSQIQVRDTELEAHRQNLQKLVDQRTNELQNSNKQLTIELAARSEAEKMALKEKVQAQMYLDIAEVAIIAIGVDQTVVRVNKKCCTLLGVQERDILGKNWFEHFIPQREKEAVKEAFIQLMSGKVELASYLENTVVTTKGEERLIAWHNTIIIEDNGQISAVLSSGEDITERKIAEQALRESEEKFHTITASAQDAILMMDNEGKITFWNEAAEKIFGYSEKEVLGWPLHELLAPERFIGAHQEAFKHFKKTGEGTVVGKTVELAALKKDGTEFPIELSLSAIMKDGRWNAIGMIRDISERKKMEKELQEKEELMLIQSKQAAMGDMIAMIAHQWRQPLAIMGMDINNLMMSIALEEEITPDYLLKLAETLNGQVQQLSETIDNFRNFFKPDQSKEQATIEEVLNNTLNIIGSSCENNNITLTIQNTSTSSLFINKSSLMQVLLNILGNAKDMLVAKKVAHAAITVTVNEINEVITISICDNAGGIPESNMTKIG